MSISISEARYHLAYTLPGAVLDKCGPVRRWVASATDRLAAAGWLKSAEYCWNVLDHTWLGLSEYRKAHCQRLYREILSAILNEELDWEGIDELYSEAIRQFLPQEYFDVIHDALTDSRYAESYYEDYC